MSFPCLNWVTAHITSSKEIKLNSSAKLVLFQLASQSNDDGVCYPSHNSLSDTLGIPKRTVRRALDDLMAAGIITEYTLMGKYAKSRYILHLNHKGTQESMELEITLHNDYHSILEQEMNAHRKIRHQELGLSKTNCPTKKSYVGHFGTLSKTNCPTSYINNNRNVNSILDTNTHTVTTSREKEGVFELSLKESKELQEDFILTEEELVFQMKNMAIWLEARPKRRPVKNKLVFIRNWLRKSKTGDNSQKPSEQTDAKAQRDRLAAELRRN